MIGLREVHLGRYGWEEGVAEGQGRGHRQGQANGGETTLIIEEGYVRSLGRKPSGRSRTFGFLESRKALVSVRFSLRLPGTTGVPSCQARSPA